MNYNDNIFAILADVKAIARRRDKESESEVLTEKVFKSENFNEAKELIQDFLSEVGI